MSGKSGRRLSGRGVGDGRPVRVRAGAQAERARSGRRRARRRRWSRRAGSRRGRCRSARSLAAAARRSRVARAGRAARRGGRTHCQQLERALLEPGLHVARRRARSTAGSKPLVGEARAGRADVLGDPGGARGRADGAERARRPRRSTTPMSGSRSWNDALKRSSRQPRDASARIARELRRAPRATVAASRSRSLPPTATDAEEEAVAGRARAFSRRARSVSAAKRLLPAARPTPAQIGGDVVEVAPDALELEQDRPRARELRRSARARAPPRRRARRRRRS